MSLYVPYIGKDEKEIQLRINAARAIELEKKLGGRAIAMVIPELDKLSVTSEILAAALPKDSYENRKKKALNIFDEMIDDGKSLSEYQFLAMDVLVAAGFMKGESVKMLKETQEAANKLLAE